MSQVENNQEGQERAAHISRAGESASLLRGSLLACLGAVPYYWPLRTVGFQARAFAHQKGEGGSKSENLIPQCQSFQKYLLQGTLVHA